MISVSSNKNEATTLHSSKDICEIAAFCNYLNKESKKYVVRKDTTYHFVMKRDDGQHILCTSKKLIDLGFAAYAVHSWDTEKKADQYYNTVSEFPAEWLTPKAFKPFWMSVKKMVS